MLSRDEFLKHLREDLVHLYEPRRLRHSPLAELFGVANRFDTASALQRILVDAVKSLQPAADEPSHSRAWDVYEPLFYRFVEQLDQAAVADQMRLSVRHLRRKEADALEVLADLLWSRYSSGTVAAVPQPSAGDEVPPVGDLSWLSQDTHPPTTDLNTALPGVLDLARRLAEEHRVRLEAALPGGALPAVPGDPVALRQCLLSLLAVVIPRAAGGTVAFGAQHQGTYVALWLSCAAYPSGPKPALGDEAAGLNLAAELARLCGGRLDLDADARAFDARLWLPALAQSPVLVIDDHADALQLLERYTLGTRYSFVGSRDPEQAVPLAAQHAPCAIVLDVMMPNVDGWEVLGRLKRDPATAHIPVIVCTIMAQKEFARLLGAAAFLRKPVTRQAFLAALDGVLSNERSEEIRSNS